jgi:hypothetical protein
MIWNLGKVFEDPVAVFGGSAFLTCFQAVEVAQHICAGVPYVRMSSSAADCSMADA